MGGQRDRLLENAGKHLAKGNLERAIKELQKILAEEPDDVQTRLKVGGLLARTKKTTEALAEYEIVAKNYLGTELERRAIPVYELMIQFDGSRVDYRKDLARLYVKLGQIKDALKQYSLAAERHESEGQDAEQLQVLSQMRRLDPDNAEVLRKLADIDLRKRKGGDAIQKLRAAADRLDPQRDGEELARVMEKILALEPQKIETALILASLYHSMGNPRRALRRLQVCHNEDPRDQRVLKLLAEVFEMLGKEDKAQAVREELDVVRRGRG